ncbi:hypothetical protein SDC9_204461 [bioreactor metagenome]|uniref:Uncharacterized protein n=1 Tax=bioreactor metagenome TaxID=1076179 RepID=A0A645J243_9ZZZZ
MDAVALLRFIRLVRFVMELHEIRRIAESESLDRLLIPEDRNQIDSQLRRNGRDPGTFTLHGPIT